MSKSDWMTTAAACKALGISSDHLYRLRDDGTLKQGRHWKNIGRATAARPTYRWHLQRCDDALSVPQEHRASPAPKPKRLRGKQLALVEGVKPYAIENE